MNTFSKERKLDLKNRSNTINMKYQNIFALLCFCAVTVFLCWRAHYGLGFEDESGYIAYAHRFIMGDSMISDEWNLTQLFSILLILPVKLYIAITGSFDGIVLFFRYLFIFLQSIVSGIVYIRFRKYGLLSIPASLIFYLHIPFFIIMGPGYYALGLAFVLLTGIFMATTKKQNNVIFYFVGVFFACAVLCNPVLVFVYLLYCVCIFICNTGKIKKRQFFSFSEITFTLRTWLWITLGVSTMAAIFILFLFSRTNLHELIRNFPMLFTDPEYTGSGMQNLFSIRKTIVDIMKINPYLFFAVVLLLAVITFDKKRIEHRKPYIVIMSLIFFAYIISITLSFQFPAYGYWMYPLSLLGLISYILSENKNKCVFVFLWLLGLLYAICLDVTSDLGFIISSQGLIVSDVASVIIISNMIHEIYQQNKNNPSPMKRVLAGLLTATLLVQICQECYIISNLKFCAEYLNVSAVNWAVCIQKDSKETLNYTIQNGPKKGLKTTSSKAKVYNGILNDLAKIKHNGYGNVLIIGRFPWCYLYLNMPYASLSVWFPSGNISAEKQRLVIYYSLHPEKTPKTIYISKLYDYADIYIPKTVMKEIFDEITKGYNYTVKESDYGYWIQITK